MLKPDWELGWDYIKKSFLPTRLKRRNTILSKGEINN